MIRSSTRHNPHVVNTIGKSYKFTFPGALAYVSPNGALPHEVSSQTVVSERAAVQLPRALGSIRHEQIPAVTPWSPLVFGLAMGLFAAVVGVRAPSALAADLDNGESVFAASCASCHAGGGNTVSPDKKLKKEALQQFGKYEPAMIVAQVTKGNGAMPAFGERISPEDIGDVAAYVRAQADKGW